MSLSLLQAIGNSNESFRSPGDTHRAHGHSVKGAGRGGWHDDRWDKRWRM